MSESVGGDWIRTDRESSALGSADHPYFTTVLDREHLQGLLDERVAAHDAMAASKVQRIREDMDARRCQITHVPAPVRSRDRRIGIREPVQPRYERIAFEKSRVSPQGQSLATFVCPGHPLLDAVIDLTPARKRDLFKRGTVLVDERDEGMQPCVVFYLEHAIQDAGLTRPTASSRSSATTSRAACPEPASCASSR